MIKWLIKIAVKRVLTEKNIKNAISTGVNALLAKADKDALAKYGVGLANAAGICSKVSERIADGKFTDAERDMTITEAGKLLDVSLTDSAIEGFVERIMERI